MGAGRRLAARSSRSAILRAASVERRGADLECGTLNSPKLMISLIGNLSCQEIKFPFRARRSGWAVGSRAAPGLRVTSSIGAVLFLTISEERGISTPNIVHLALPTLVWA